jgi:hypothetical protein
VIGYALREAALTSKMVGQGAALGRSVSHGVAEPHDGRLSVGAAPVRSACAARRTAEGAGPSHHRQPGERRLTWGRALA